MTTENETESVNPLAEIVLVQEVIAHPNADALDLISPDGSGVNWAIVGRGSVKVGDKIVWLDAMNDPIVPMDRPEFAMLAQRAKGKPTYRIRAMRLRGWLSRGLVIPWLPEYGDTNAAVTAALGLTKYEPPAYSGRAGGSLYPGLQSVGPDKLLPTAKYDVDSLAREWKEIPAGAVVNVTEKIHGANAAYGWLSHKDEIQFCVRSRSMWKAREGGGSWWAAAEAADLENRLRDYHGLLVYGEIYGQVQDLKYGRDDVAFVAFDVWDSTTLRWYSWAEVVSFCESIGISHVPHVAAVEWPEGRGIPESIRELAEGQSLMPGADNIREGIVIRWDSYWTTEAGHRYPKRLILKLVGNGYLTR
jgi:RNA ligase (TIGR02306 family)